MTASCYCTIITSNYIPFALILLESIKVNSTTGFKLEVLLSDTENVPQDISVLEEKHAELHFIGRSEMRSKLAEKISQAYHASNMDAYRWSMKPVFLHHLLSQCGYEKVIYLDSDICFYSNGDFLFDLLEKHRMILTPHWRCADNPKVDMENFAKNFTDGIYNAGFIGVRSDSLEVLEFWGECCAAACRKDKANGFFVDQRYLELLPARFEGIGTVLHRGCNVSEWNLTDCWRETLPDGSIRIAGKYDLVFVHFTWWTIVQILRGDDPHLLPLLQKYAEDLKKIHPDSFDILSWAMEKFNKSFSQVKPTLRDKVKLRTRIRAFWNA